ncbi:hypothetical protein ACQJBY_028114 [Aegilops geniculata]
MPPHVASPATTNSSVGIYGGQDQSAIAGRGGPKAKPTLAAAMTEAEAKELPKAIAWQLAQDKLAWVAVAGAGEGGGWRCGGQGRHGRLRHSANIFIHCLSATSE